VHASYIYVSISDKKRSIAALLADSRDDLSMRTMRNERVCLLLNATAPDVDVLRPAMSKSLRGVLLIENVIVVSQKQLLYSR